jgi:hypothetical protein
MKRLFLLASLAATSACFHYTDGPPARPPPVLRKIEDAKILVMDVHLWKQIGLCPGLEGKLYANANVQWPNAKPVPRNIGTDVDSLHASDFQVVGALVKGDDKARLFPDPDVKKSIEGGFDATVVYKPDPAKWTFKLNFPPEYSCYGGWFDDGGMGGGGGPGGDGGNNGPATDGTNGGNGGPGLQGNQGGKITAFVTVVSTPYWPRLFAVIANGNFFLAPADRDLVFGAAGGQGGPGGNGGQGGQGGDQVTEVVSKPTGKGSTTTVTRGKGRAGNGGRGGNGGKGGKGGKGGSVDVTIDAAFPELARFIKADVSGGAGGYGGARGGGGAGGGTNADSDQNPQVGTPGEDGAPGGDGDRGDPGGASIHGGQVASKFAGIKGLAIFGSPQAANMAKTPPRGATQGFGPPSANSVVVAPASSSDKLAAPPPGPAAPLPPGPSVPPAKPGPMPPSKPLPLNRPPPR